LEDCDGGIAYLGIHSVVELKNLLPSLISRMESICFGPMSCPLNLPDNRHFDFGEL